MALAHRRLARRMIGYGTLIVLLASFLVVGAAEVSVFGGGLTGVSEVEFEAATGVVDDECPRPSSRS
jgi:hypothetical protein